MSTEKKAYVSIRIENINDQNIINMLPQMIKTQCEREGIDMSKPYTEERKENYLLKDHVTIIISQSDKPML